MGNAEHAESIAKAKHVERAERDERNRRAFASCGALADLGITTIVRHTRPARDRRRLRCHVLVPSSFARWPAQAQSWFTARREPVSDLQRKEEDEDTDDQSDAPIYSLETVRRHAPTRHAAVQ